MKNPKNKNVPASDAKGSQIKNAKKNAQKELSKNVLASSLAKKYLIDYENLSEKDQKKERSKRRRAIDSFINVHFNAITKKDDKALKELKATFKSFVQANYVHDLKTCNAKDLYNAKDEKKCNDLQSLIEYVRS